MNYILVLLVLIAVAAGDATPNDNSTIIRQGIVFEKKGLALVNAPLVKFQKKYKPCDEIILKSRFEKLLLQYENLCKTVANFLNQFQQIPWAMPLAVT